MKMFKVLLSLLMLLTSLCGCTSSNTKNVPHNIFQGVVYDGDLKIMVEVFIQEDEIKHIELVEHPYSISFEKQAIYLFDDIINHGNLNQSKYDLSYHILFDAVLDALKKNNLSYETLNKFEQTPKQLLNYDYQVVIVGAGGAGLTAAIEAYQQGYRKIAIIEKMSFAGGNTRMSNGCYGANNNWNQNETMNALDSPESFYQDIYQGGHKIGNSDLIHVLSNHALEDALWLKNEVDVHFTDDLMWYEGHQYMRSLRIENDGIGLINALMAKVDELDIDIFYTTIANQLIIENNKVTTLIASNNDDVLTFTASSGIILATGGFSANKQMLAQYNDDPYFTSDHYISTNSPAITGDGIHMAQEIGANLVDMDLIQFYPINNPATGNFYRLDYARLNDNALLINSYGERFVDEHQTRDVISKAILNQPSALAYELIDQNTLNRTKVNETYAAEILSCSEQGVLYKGSLKECADFFGVSYYNLQETLVNYNQMVDHGIDNEFQRLNIQEINIEGQFVMFAANVSVHHTMGGIEIDTNARVLDQEKNPINHLYAAGEITGGIHGDNRLGSVALTDCIVFGRIAGASVKVFE